MYLRLHHFLGFSVLLSLLISITTFGQATDASIVGVIKATDGQLLPGATVTARNESTGFQTSTVSNVEGRYVIRQAPLGGPYTITISYIGFANQVRTGYRLNQGDLLTVNVDLTENASDLQEVTVTENALKNRTDRLGASTAITAGNIAKLPINNRSFTNLLALSPLSNGGSVGGQLPSSTNYLIDGASARNNLTSGALGNGPYSLSLEAIREFEISTNDYDVTKGRQFGQCRHQIGHEHDHRSGFHLLQRRRPVERTGYSRQRPGGGFQPLSIRLQFGRADHQRQAALLCGLGPANRNGPVLHR